MVIFVRSNDKLAIHPARVKFFLALVLVVYVVPMSILCENRLYLAILTHLSHLFFLRSFARHICSASVPPFALYHSV